MDTMQGQDTSTAGIGLVNNSRTGDPWAGQTKYSRAVVTVLSTILLVAAVVNLQARWIRDRKRRGASTRFAAALRLIKYRQPPSYRLGHINFRLPALGATLLMCLLMLGFTTWMFVVQPYYRDTRDSGSPPLALRSGMMAVGLMPFIYVLGSKVNFIAMITGTSHERLQIYHQWMARFMLFLATVHTIPFIHQPLAEGGVQGLRTEFYSDSMNTTGAVAYACLFVLSFASATRIREKSYELFLLIHVPVAAIFLAFMFVHSENLLTSWRYLWGTAAMWMLSVFLRFAGQLSKNSFLSLYESRVEALPQEMTRMTVRSPLRWKPGQHVFVRFPALSPLSAHPFTIVSMPASDQHQLISNIVLMAKSHDGLTKRLHQLACKDSTLSLYAIIDGPYGQDADVSNHDRVLFIAGGSGITFVLASLLHLAWKWQRGLSKPHDVHLVWSIREAGSILWVRPHLNAIEALAPDGAFKFSLYLSRKASHLDQLDIPPSWELHNGPRPDVGAIVHDFARASPNQADIETNLPHLPIEAQSAAVLTCGPTAMTNDAANAVASIEADLAMGRFEHLSQLRLITERFGS